MTRSPKTSAQPPAAVCAMGVVPATSTEHQNQHDYQKQQTHFNLPWKTKELTGMPGMVREPCRFRGPMPWLPDDPCDPRAVRCLEPDRWRLFAWFR